MIGVSRSTINADSTSLATVFLALLDDVVIIVAERLPIAPIPEQALVAAVRCDVVDHQADAARVGLYAAVGMHGAGVEQTSLPALYTEQVLRLREEVGALMFPLGVVAALAGGETSIAMLS